MKILLKFCAFVLGAVAFAGCDKEGNDVYTQLPENDNIIVSLAAGDSTAMAATMDQFRQHAGSPVNTAPGATGGRREVNWDGMPDNSPADFFNPTDAAAPAGRKRGLVYFPANILLRTSVDRFSDIEPSYGNQFAPFSKARLFNGDGSNITDVRFKVPGTNTDASVKAFGVVFSDVDLVNTTAVEIYNGNSLLGTAKAPPSNGKFSFVALRVKEGRITRVKITTGNAVLSAGVKDISDGGSDDLVVMDDFIYSEPVSQ